MSTIDPHQATNEALLIYNAHPESYLLKVVHERNNHQQRFEYLKAVPKSEVLDTRWHRIKAALNPDYNKGHVMRCVNTGGFSEERLTANRLLKTHPLHSWGARLWHALTGKLVQPAQPGPAEEAPPLRRQSRASARVAPTRVPQSAWPEPGRAQPSQPKSALPRAAQPEPARAAHEIAGLVAVGTEWQCSEGADAGVVAKLLLGHIERLKPDQREGLPPNFDKALQQYARDRAFNLADQLKLRDLPPGHCMLFQIGSRDHAVAAMIIKTGEGYTMRIGNTGEGVQHHPTTGLGGHTPFALKESLVERLTAPRKRQAFQIEGITDLKKIGEFLNQTHNSQEPAKTYIPKLYNTWIRELGGRATTLQEHGKIKPWHTEQTGGSCASGCLFSLLVTVMPRQNVRELRDLVRQDLINEAMKTAAPAKVQLAALDAASRLYNREIKRLPGFSPMQQTGARKIRAVWATHRVLPASATERAQAFATLAIRFLRRDPPPPHEALQQLSTEALHKLLLFLPHLSEDDRLFLNAAAIQVHPGWLDQKATLFKALKELTATPFAPEQ